jgi:LysR family transcriptional regulator, hypochlorite-specific transcription factor HypT
MVDTRWLNDFLTTAEMRNFSRAAEVLTSTQPALSRRIHALEEWLGVRLFNRDTQPISLTPEGELLRPTAEEILCSLQRARAEIRGMRERRTSLLRFITTHGLATTVLPNWLGFVEAVTGTISMRLETARLDDCATTMVNGESDFMLAYTHPTSMLPLDPRAFQSVVIEHNLLVPVSAPDENGAPRHPVPGLAENRPSGYLAYTLSSGFGRLLDQCFGQREESLNLQRVFESHLAGVVKIMALEGRGATWLASRYVTADIASGHLVPAGDEEFSIELEVRLFRPTGRMSPACEQFWMAVGEASSQAIR